MVAEFFGIPNYTIPLPSHALRIDGPDLVLLGEAACFFVLDPIRHTGGLQPVGRGMNFFVAKDLDAQMVEALVGIRVFEKDEFEWRLGDGKVGIAGFALVHLGIEELGVEIHRLIDIFYIESKLYTHGKGLLESCQREIEWNIGFRRSRRTIVDTKAILLTGAESRSAKVALKPVDGNICRHVEGRQKIGHFGPPIGETAMMWVDELKRDAKAILPSVVELRRALHRKPELGNDLPETRALVLEALADLGFGIEKSERTTSFVATLKGGSPGRCVLLRADMDALPMPEDSGLEFASENPGRMHACGHDVHTAMLAGAARLLARRADSLAGDIKFFFQTGEEGHFGAKICSEEGLLERGRAPDAAFALHIDPRMTCGRVAGRAGALLASTTEWAVDIKGKGGHASMPHNAVDPIPAACEMVAALQSMVTRRINAFDPAVITTTQVHAGTTDNVIPETARLSGTLRATSERSRAEAEAGIHRIAQGVAQAHGVDAEVSVADGYPVTFNEAIFTEFASAVVDQVLGEGSYSGMPTPLMGGEDFSYILQRWPGAMFFLGMRDPGIADPAPVHSNRMVLDENGMTHGMLLHAGVALTFLRNSDDSDDSDDSEGN